MSTTKVRGRYADAQACLAPFGRPADDLWHFEGVPVGVLRTILRAHPEVGADTQNDAPSFATLVEAVGDSAGATFHGYCVTAARSDERITLEGFCSPFARTICRKHDWRPDELDSKRAWWD